MKILVCGSRFWKDVEIVAMIIASFPKEATIIHGACKGADFIAGECAEQLGLKVRKYHADWKRLGKSAGPIRNQKMISKEHTQDEPIDLCVAFHDELENSAGTLDMTKRASSAGIPIRLVTTKEFDNVRRTDHKL